MSDPKSDAKDAKKAAKAQAKIEKKQAKANSGDIAPAAAAPEGPTPAERSAAAAEGQVRINRARMIIGILALVIAIVSFLVTVKPWKYLAGNKSPAGEETPKEPAAP